MIGAAEAINRTMNAAVGFDLVIRTSQRADGEIGGAMFSRCQSYRYLLWRVWQPDLPLWSFGMLNPSTADHEVMDPTIKRCFFRASAGGAGGLIVWNLFAWRSTDPADMKQAGDPVGPANDTATLMAVRDCAKNIAGWGAHGDWRGRDIQVRRLLAMTNVPLCALDFTNAGQPKHPLYLSARLPALPWRYAA